MPLLASFATVVLLHTGLQERYRKKYLRTASDRAAGERPGGRERPPSVDVVIPTYNEDPAILKACFASLAAQDYQGELRFVVVDDGSSNLEELLPVYRSYQRLPQWTVLIGTRGNLGKREAQHAAIYGSPRAFSTLGPEDSGAGGPDQGGWPGSSAEYVLMVDSDTVVEPDGVRRILAPFADPAVGAVTGDVGILNHAANRLTGLIATRYRVLFDHERAAQSRFGLVFCCAGPFSAYPREALDAVWGDYRTRKFGRAVCTFGDDLQLTNLMLERGRKSIYQPKARAWTTAPTTLKGYFRQQWRWNRSFYRQFRWILPVLRRNRNPYQAFDLVARAIPAPMLTAAFAALLFDLVTLDHERLPGDLATVAGMAAVGLVSVLWQTGDGRFALLYGLLYVSLLLPARIWALCTLTNSQWSTRTPKAAESGSLPALATGAARAPVREPASP